MGSISFESLESVASFCMSSPILMSSGGQKRCARSQALPTATLNGRIDRRVHRNSKVSLPNFATRAW